MLLFACFQGEFGNLSGSLINICLFLKSQIASGKSVDFLTLQDGKGSTFQTTRVGLVCASIPYVVKYTGRGTEIRPEGLPLGQDPRLLRGYVTLVTAGTGGPGMSPFAACILLVGELIDEFQTGEKPSEYSVLFGQLNAGRLAIVHKRPRPILLNKVTLTVYCLCVCNPFYSDCGRGIHWRHRRLLDSLSDEVSSLHTSDHVSRPLPHDRPRAQEQVCVRADLCAL